MQHVRDIPVYFEVINQVKIDLSKLQTAIWFWMIILTIFRGEY